MTRDFHVAEDDPALRCLIKLEYVRVALQAKSEEFYVLDTGKLQQLVAFMRTSEGLEDVVSCIAK